MTDRDLFIAALDHPDPLERAAWFDAAGVDTEARRRVDILLRAHDQASRFLAVPAAAEVAAEAPTRTGHPADETTPTSDVDVLAVLTPSDIPGHLGRLAHFEVLEIVGRGGMGVVLKALDPKLHRLVAVKLMSPHLAASSAARKRFEREAKAVAAVKNEHVVAIHDVAPDAAAPYLVMEFIGGVSLQDRLERSGPLELKEVLRIGMQAARGLAAAHAQGLVHRDVKPANILLENGVERVKLTDFGLARAVDDANLTQSGVIAGTPNYMSPEQANGATVDARSDLFSLGSVLYSLCAGHPPFRADTAMAVLKRVCDDAPRPLPEINPDVPAWLDAIVRKLLAKNPADRFQTATAVAELLGRHLAHLQNPTVVPPPAPDDPAVKPGEWRAILNDPFSAEGPLLRNFLTLLLTLGLGLFWMHRPETVPWAIPIVAGALMFVVMDSVLFQWHASDRGRFIVLHRSTFIGTRLYVNGVLVARGGRGRREIEGVVPDGPGKGNRIRARTEAHLFWMDVRIEEREGTGDPGVEPPPAATPLPLPSPDDRGWTQIFEATDRRLQTARHAVQLAGCLLIVGALVSFVTDWKTADELADLGRDGHPALLQIKTFAQAAVFLAPGVGLLVVSAFFRQRWEAPYKGRTVRVQNTVLSGPCLYVDGVFLALGGPGWNVELRGTIPAGPAAGVGIRALTETGFTRARCRIFVDEPPAPSPIPVPVPTAPGLEFRKPERPPIAGCLLGLGFLAAVAAALIFRDALWDVVFRRGYFAPIFLAFQTVLLVFLTWLLRKQPDAKAHPFTYALAFVLSAAGIVVGGIVWWNYIGVSTKTMDVILWALLGSSAACVVINLPILFRRKAGGDPEKARREWRMARWVVLAFGGTALICVARLLIYPVFEDDPTRLVVKWNYAFVDRVTIERDGEAMDDFQGKESGVGYPYRRGAYTIRGFLRGETVYREVVRLESGKERGASLFDDRIWYDMPVLHVRSEDPGLRFTVTSADHDLSWSGAREIKQPLVAGSSYEFQVARGSTVVCSEPIKLGVDDRGFGDTRFLHFPRLGMAPRTTDLRPLKGSFPPDVIRMAFSPDGTLVAAARLDGPILVFDAATGRETFTVRRLKSDCTAFGFTPGGKALAYVDDPGTGAKAVQFVSAADGQALERLVPGPEHGLTNSHALAFSPDGRRLAVGSATNVGGRYRFRSRVLRWELPDQGQAKQQPPFESMPGTVSSLLFSPDGQTVRAVGGSEEPTGWDWTTGAVNQVMQNLFRDRGVGDYVNALAPGPTADLVLSAGYSYATVDFWKHGAPATPYRHVATTRLGAGAMAASADGKRVAVGLKGGVVGPWQSRAAVDVFEADGPRDPQTGNRKQLVRLLGHTDWVMAVRFSPDGREVISAGKDGTVRRWTVPE